MTTTIPLNRDPAHLRHGSNIGQPFTRRDGVLKVTGAAKYAADNHPPGMLYAVLAVSSIARGRVASRRGERWMSIPAGRPRCRDFPCGSGKSRIGRGPILAGPPAYGFPAAVMEGRSPYSTATGHPEQPQLAVARLARRKSGIDVGSPHAGHSTLVIGIIRVGAQGPAGAGVGGGRALMMYSAAAIAPAASCTKLKPGGSSS